jgi:hypothetical protein
MGRRSRCMAALVALVAACGLALLVLRGAVRADAPGDVSRELAGIYQADQADRQNFSGLSQEQLRAIGTRDTERRARVAEIVRKGQLQSAEDYYHAAMVFQHGNKPEEYLMAHELATVAGFKGHKGGKWLSAAAMDRFLHSIGRPQRFGTQYKRGGEGPWTQEPYDRSLPDAIRKEYGVPPLAEQAKPLEKLNEQKPEGKP